MLRTIAASLFAAALAFVAVPAQADEPKDPVEGPARTAPDEPAPDEPAADEPESSTGDDDEPDDHGSEASPDPQDPEPSQEDAPDDRPDQGPVEPQEEPTPTIELPEDPDARLVMARKAFRRTDYGLLVPLLQPLVGPDSPLLRLEDRIAARELLAVGYFFMAQQVTNPDERKDLLDRARDVFLELLREQPDHSLDNLIFPVSVVELFEAVRRDNAEELQQLMRDEQEVAVDGELETLYIERATVVGIWWINLLPFGAGQFQNGDVAKGTAFLLLEAGALALNAGSYFAILSLRNENGRFDTTGGNDSDLAKALRWRRNLYIGLSTFAGLWILSAVDGILNFESERVRIRTLDAPPPELGGVTTGTGTSERLPLGLSFEFIW